MRNLLLHYAALTARLGASYLFIVSVALVVWWFFTGADTSEGGALYLLISPSMIGWFTLLLVIQVGSLYHLLFRAEALQVRVARIRNRSVVLGSMYLLLGILAALYSIPYLLVFLRLAPFADLAWLSALNMLVYHLFVVFAGFAILRVFDGGNLGTISLVSLLFVIPNILNMVLQLVRPDALWARWLGGLLTNHVRILSNPDMLLLREIQDSDVLLSTAGLGVLVAGAVFLRFRRADLH